MTSFQGEHVHFVNICSQVTNDLTDPINRYILHFCGLYRQLSILDCLILNVSYASVHPRLSVVKRTKLILLLLGKMAGSQ